MDLNDVRSLVTLVSLLLFIGLMVWTWLPSRRAVHEDAAKVLFDEGGTESDERGDGRGDKRGDKDGEVLR